MLRPNQASSSSRMWMTTGLFISFANCKLLFQCLALEGAFVAFLDPVIIQPDLADGDDFGMSCQFLHLLERGFRRIYPNLLDGTPQPHTRWELTLPTEPPPRLTLWSSPWHENPHQPRIHCALNHLRAVGVEFVVVEVAVGVGEFMCAS